MTKGRRGRGGKRSDKREKGKWEGGGGRVKREGFLERLNQGPEHSWLFLSLRPGDLAQCIADLKSPLSLSLQARGGRFKHTPLMLGEGSHRLSVFLECQVTVCYNIQYTPPSLLPPPSSFLLPPPSSLPS